MLWYPVKHGCSFFVKALNGVEVCKNATYSKSNKEIFSAWKHGHGKVDSFCQRSQSKNDIKRNELFKRSTKDLHKST